MTVRTLALLALAPLAACTAPTDAPTQRPDVPEMSTIDPEPPVSPEASGDVAREAQLTVLQGDELLELGVPVLLPTLGEEWTVRDLETSTEYGTTYDISWRRSDGACLWMTGSNDGLGGPDYPTRSAEVAIRSLPGEPRYKAYKAADDPASPSAENWGAGAVVTDYVETGLMWHWFISSSDDGCRPLALEEAATILASLRPLDPADVEAQEEGAFGRFADADDVLVDFLTDVPVTQTPAADVEAFLSGWEAAELLIEDMGETEGTVTVLATLLGLYDDSVQGERYLFAFVPASGGGWELERVGRQTRCYPGRGHQAWSDAICI